MVRFQRIFIRTFFYASDRRYSTGSDLNTYSALIQNFYSQETAPHQAIHVSVSTGVDEGQEAGVRAYIRLVSFLASVYD